MPLVSVILPLFNAEQTIKRAVQSILGQNFRDLELIIIDDGSNDKSIERLNQIKDPRMKVVRAEHRGVAHAANLGLSYAQGQWIARMDADDEAYPNRIKKQIRWSQEQDLDVVGCQVRIVDSNKKIVNSLNRYQAWINQETLLPDAIAAFRFVELPVVNPTLFGRREYFELGYVDDSLPEDYDLFLRGVSLGFRFGKVPEVLFDWHDSATRLTRLDSKYSRDAFDQCRRKHLLAGPLGSHKEVDFWGAGSTGKPWLRWLNSSGIRIVRCFDVSQKKIGQTIHGCVIQNLDALSLSSSRPLLIAVGRKGARALIRASLERVGYVPGLNAWFVA